MDFEKLAAASHQAWFLAMARQGWTFGPRLSQEFKTHPWLKPYPGLSDAAKEIVRAQVRGVLQALETEGVSDVKGLAGQAPPPAPGPVTTSPRPAPAVEPAPVRQTAAAPVGSPAAPKVSAAAPLSKAQAPEPAGLEAEVIERRVDASGRMRIGSGLVKKAELLKGGAHQVTILQAGNVIEVLPYDPAAAGAFYASVNPDGFMLPKAMLAGTGAQDFILSITPGRLIVRPR
ncbi:MAG: RyR domain-containing protein [Candidatus Sericytochromatia bacterium]|nr:RyR domain-containing protein [Candidatus Sericytochromatia bacterium]